MSGTRTPRRSREPCWAGVAVPVWQCCPGSFGKRIPSSGHPRGWRECGSKELMEQKSQSAVTSADLHPSQETPAQSPWRLGESLDASRPAQPGSSRAPAAAVGARGELGSLPGSLLGSLPGSPGLLGAVTLQDELQPAALCPCWDTRNGAEGCVPQCSSPSGCRQWEHWFCTRSLLPCRTHALPRAHGLAVLWEAEGIQGMLRDTGMQPCSLPPSPEPLPGLSGRWAQFSGLGLGLGSAPPQPPHPGAGCAHVPILVWVPVP